MAVFGIQYIRQGAAVTTAGAHDVAANAVVEFDTPRREETGMATYTDGVFTFVTAGDYYIAWQVAVKTAVGLEGQQFDLEFSDGETTPTVVKYPSSSGLKNGQLSGTALIRIPSIGGTETWTIKLVNSGANSTLNDTVEYNASISILKAVQSLQGVVFQCLQTAETDDVTVASDAAVLFDTTATYAGTNTNITLTAATGTITVAQPGRYLFDWAVNVVGSTGTNAVKFKLEKSEPGEPATVTEVGLSESPVNQPYTVYGSTVVDVGVANTTFTLKNANIAGVTHTLSGVSEAGADPLRAWIRVVEVA
ncbi:MAG: hypothetical protein Q4F05_07790 [bacterium]|nr:hypothetical protein [bacterium]